MDQDTLQQSSHRYSTLTSTPSCSVRCVRNGPRYPTAELPQVQYPTSTPSRTVRCVRNGPRYPIAELLQVQYPNIYTPPGKQTPGYGQRAASTHPTGMHSCRFYFFHGRAPVQFTALLINVFVSFTVENPYSLLPCSCHEATPGKTAVKLGPLWCVHFISYAQ